MRWWERWCFHAVFTVVSVSGILYYVMKYLMETDDPFALVNHPWQPGMLAAHVVVAPLTVAFFGMLFRSHVVPNVALNHPLLRRSGWVSLLSFIAMGLTGYLIQIASSPEAVSVFSWLHIVTSLVFLAGYIAHLILDWRFHRMTA